MSPNGVDSPPRATDEATIEALSQGFQGAFFRQKSVAVAVPDLTRPIDYELVLSPLFALLDEVGAHITVVVAHGLHRRLNPAEIAPLERLAADFGAQVIQHDADADDLVEVAADVGADQPGWPELPAQFNPAIAAAERIICVGMVEPHQYAGFSGGAKTVAIGCAGHATIGAMHGLELLRDPHTTLGAVEANPFQAALWSLARSLGPMWGLLVVPHSHDMCWQAGFGPLYGCFEDAVQCASTVYFETVDAPYDWLHLPVSGPKAVNFYQASRAATYAGLVERSAVGAGGLLVVEAACPEGVGRGVGEQAFGRAMTRGRDQLLAELGGARQAPPSVGGQQRAYVLAKTLDRADIALVGAEPITELSAMGIDTYDSVSAAVDAHACGPRGRTVDDIFHRIPQLNA